MNKTIKIWNRKLNFNAIISLTLILLSSCQSLRLSQKSTVTDGKYTLKKNASKQSVFLEMDSIGRIYSFYSFTEKDNNGKLKLVEQMHLNQLTEPITLRRPSIDLDLITIPLKYRPATLNVEQQLNTSINASIYLGYRRDNYRLTPKLNPINHETVSVTHLGFSFGFLSGFGSTFLSPTTTNNLISQEYDGLVWSNGLASVFALNAATFGISLGIDQLLDANKAKWIYQKKPWLGIAIGLNIN